MIGKTVLIPIAAFAITATGVSAFNSDMLEDIGLSNSQISAFEEAHELRMDGDKKAARAVLEDAGIDRDTLKEVRTAMHENRATHRTAIHKAAEDNDYDAFKEAVEGSPLADIVTSQSDFDQFVEAYELREDGDRETAHEIMEDLGFEPGEHGKGHKDMDGKRGEHRGNGPAQNN